MSTRSNGSTNSRSYTGAGRTQNAERNPNTQENPLVERSRSSSAWRPTPTQPSTPPPTVRLNSVECAPSKAECIDGVFTYDVPERALADEEHVIEVFGNTFVGGKFLKVTRVEFSVGRKGAPA